MKRSLLLFLSVVCVCALALCACGGDKTPTETPPAGKEFSGITFSDANVPYDGNEHTIEIEGELPEGASVSYKNNKGTETGAYHAEATLTCDGYRTTTLTATLTIVGLDFDAAIVLNDKTVTYTGAEFGIAIEGEDKLPTGANVAYAENKGVNAGEYHATATLTCRGYNTKVLEATLTIEKATMTGITFADERVSYDGHPHTIAIAGVRPDGSTVVYACDNPNMTCNANGATATASGTYRVTATVSNPNYHDLVLEAILSIKGSEKERHIGAVGNTLYFANALDLDNLYRWDGSAVSRVSTDTPFYFVNVGNALYYKSSALFGTSIRKATASGEPSTVAAVTGDYLCSDGTNLYYVKNALTAEKSGIYRIPCNADENTEPTLVSAGKAYYLQVANGTLYFADGANGKKLSSVSAAGSNAARTQVLDKEIKTLVAANGALYYTVDGINDYIERYDPSSRTTRKLTNDAGIDLTVVGNTLYYLNADLLTSTLYGDGIYSVPANPSSDNQKSGTQVLVTAGTQYSSLTAVGNKLAFYRVSDQMLCVFDPSAKTTVEVLAGFEPVEYTPLSLGSKTVAYRNAAGRDFVYYLDLYNNKSIYAFDTVDKTFSKITSEKVSDFSIVGDMLYYNAVSFGVNNDLYKVDLKEGGIPERISKNDCVELVSDGRRLFFGLNNQGGFATAIHMIDETGAETEIYDKGIHNLVCHEGALYFVNGESAGKFMKIDVSGDTIGAPATIADHNVDVFVIDGDTVYFREKGIVNKYLSCMKLDGSDYSQMVTKIDPLRIWVKDGMVYYYSDTVSTGNDGIFRVETSCRADSKTPQLLLARKTATSEYGFCAEQFVIVGDTLYFVNFYNNLGDSHFYALPLGGGTPERLD